MHPNLEKRFVDLAVAQSTLEFKRIAFATRFHVLFAALAKEPEWTVEKLAAHLGWEPFTGENQITRGVALPSQGDCDRLVELYLQTCGSRPSGELCPTCGWPLKPTIEEGCTAGNCCQRPTPKVTT